MRRPPEASLPTLFLQCSSWFSSRVNSLLSLFFPFSVRLLINFKDRFIEIIFKMFFLLCRLRTYNICMLILYYFVKLCFYCHPAVSIFLRVFLFQVCKNCPVFSQYFHSLVPTFLLHFHLELIWSQYSSGYPDQTRAHLTLPWARSPAASVMLSQKEFCSLLVRVRRALLWWDTSLAELAGQHSS